MASCACSWHLQLLRLMWVQYTMLTVIFITYHHDISPFKKYPGAASLIDDLGLSCGPCNIWHNLHTLSQQAGASLQCP